VYLGKKSCRTLSSNLLPITTQADHTRVPAIDPPHYLSKIENDRHICDGIRTTIKLQDFIVINPVQNNQTINSNCFKSICTSSDIYKN